jgi:prolyl-tRNA synthetase
LNLNPVDAEDTAILNAIDRLSQSEQLDEKLLQELSDRIALLLKHDWERAKVEAKQADFALRPITQISSLKDNERNVRIRHSCCGT